MKSDSFLILHRQQATETYKAQKCSKDVVKIVHLSSVVQHSFYAATRILLVRKENKNNDFIQQFLLFRVVLHK